MRASLERLGAACDPEYPAVGQLDRALAAAKETRFLVDDDLIDHHGAQA